MAPSARLALMTRGAARSGLVMVIPCLARKRRRQPCSDILIPTGEPGTSGVGSPPARQPEHRHKNTDFEEVYTLEKTGLFINSVMKVCCISHALWFYICILLMSEVMYYLNIITLWMLFSGCFHFLISEMISA